jgi:hypothetical protein
VHRERAGVGVVEDEDFPFPLTELGGLEGGDEACEVDGGLAASGRRGGAGAGAE